MGVPKVAGCNNAAKSGRPVGVKDQLILGDPTGKTGGNRALRRVTLPAAGCEGRRVRRRAASETGGGARRHWSAGWTLHDQLTDMVLSIHSPNTSSCDGKR